MADLLRITTPLVTKNPPSLQKQADPKEVFSLQELVKVVKSNPQSELLMQNNGLIEESGKSSILVDMLKDPSATVEFLRNIFVLQEILGLLPLNNQTVTPEIRRMFESLFVSTEEIVPELIRQENSATSFKGTLFDIIRTALRGGSDQDILPASLRLLKAVGGALGRRDALDSVANSLEYLSNALSSSRSLSEKLSDLSRAFRQPVTQERLTELKAQILPLFAEIENSVLYSPKIEKLLPLITYNLSRFSDNSEQIPEIAERFFSLLESDDAKAEFMDALRSVLTRPVDRPPVTAGTGFEASALNTEADLKRSRVLDTLVRLIVSQAENGEKTPAAKSRFEKVVYSLLSSPSNFTPLLHFIVPVRYEDISAFAELWINPTGEDDSGPGSGEGDPCIHLLAVIDVSGVGQFEAELFSYGRSVYLNLLCPPEHIELFASLERSIRQSIAGTGFRFEKISIGKLTRMRSLIEVFTSLPQRRMGIDIRV